MQLDDDSVRRAINLPLYRLEKDFARRGFPIARSTMNDLLHRTSELTQPARARRLPHAPAALLPRGAADGADRAEAIDLVLALYRVEHDAKEHSIWSIQNDARIDSAAAPNVSEWNHII